MANSGEPPPKLAAADALRDVFHRVNRIVPDFQEMAHVPAGTSARDALILMRASKYSQLPVLSGGTCLGVFSFRSFALGVSSRAVKDTSRPEDLPVEEFLEPQPFVDLADDISAIVGMLEDGVVLVGTRERLRYIVTAADALRYLHRVASAFFLLQEIELALRLLIQRCVDESSLAECARIVLANLYELDRLPTRLEEMSFNDYCQLLTSAKVWHHFKGLLRVPRERVVARVQPARELRNVVFHFRRELIDDDYRTLQETRDWLRSRHEIASAQEEPGHGS